MAMTSDAGRRDLLSVRRSLRRLALVSCCEIYPGSREYRRHANLFMPLQVRLGQDVESLESVTWRPGLEANGFFLILGASGSGKTETLKAVGRHILEHGIPVLVLDFHGDVRVPGLSSVLMSSGTDCVIALTRSSNCMALARSVAFDLITRQPLNRPMCSVSP